MNQNLFDAIVNIDRTVPIAQLREPQRAGNAENKTSNKASSTASVPNATLGYLLHEVAKRGFYLDQNTIGAIVNRPDPLVGDILLSNIVARGGELVDTKENADVVFDITDDNAHFDASDLLANWL